MTSERRTLVIHGGFAKTGTSALQVTFAQNHAWLESKGISYPKLGNFDRAHAGEVTSGNGQSLARYLAGLSDDGAGFEEALLAIHESRTPIALLSSEFFQSSNTDRLGAFLERARGLGFDVRAFFFVRSYYDFLRSSYVQNVRNHGLGASFADWTRSTKVHRMYLDTLRDFDSVLGRENVVVANYDAARNDLFTTFLALACSVGVDADAVRPTVRVNRSLVGEEVEYIRQFNRTTVDARKGAYLSDVLVAARPDLRDATPVDPDVLARLRAAVAADLEVLNERVLGGPIGVEPVRNESTGPGPTLSTAEMNQVALFHMFGLVLDACGGLNTLSTALDELAKRVDRSD